MNLGVIGYPGYKKPAYPPRVVDEKAGSTPARWAMRIYDSLILAERRLQQAALEWVQQELDESRLYGEAERQRLSDELIDAAIEYARVYNRGL